MSMLNSALHSREKYWSRTARASMAAPRGHVQLALLARSSTDGRGEVATQLGLEAGHLHRVEPVGAVRVGDRPPRREVLHLWHRDQGLVPIHEVEVDVLLRHHLGGPS